MDLYKSLDNGAGIIYHRAMLTIKDTQDILSISYPTALDFAKSAGTLIGGKWYLPDEAVAIRIAAEKQRVAKMEAKYRLALAVKILD